jgi:hypothetical protein
MNVARATEPLKLDGKLDEAAWGNAHADKMGEIGMGGTTVQTDVRLLYDSNSLYLGIECQEPLAERLTSGWWKSHGHDGRIYSQDCLEILVDPVGDLGQYYHFICSAMPDSKYDAALGLHKDPIHPLYNKIDVEWNGEWSHAGNIDADGGRWSVEVALPFQTLGVDPPAKGSLWKMNLGRERFVQNPDRGDPELFMWSPNLEERSFHSRAAFGDLVFD